MNLTQRLDRNNLPSWFSNNILEPLEAGTSSVFIVHGDINCLTPSLEADAEPSKAYIKLREFWRKTFKDENLVVFYNIASGLSFLKPEMEAAFKKAADLAEPEVANDPVAAARAQLVNNQPMPTDPATCLGLIEKLLRKEKNVAILINSAHFIAPASGGGTSISPADRVNIERLRNWSQSETIRDNRNIILLFTDQASKISGELRLGGNEISTTYIPKPEAGEREKYIRTQVVGSREQTDLSLRVNFLESKLDLAEKERDRKYLKGQLQRFKQQLTSFPELYSLSYDLSVDNFVVATQGLSLSQIQELLIQSKKLGIPLGLAEVKEKKYQILSNEYSDVMEVVSASRGLEDIGGMEHVKAYFRMVLDAIKKGDVRRVPVGVTLMGPPGTGKTAFVEALAKEAGFHFIKIKNVRSMWVGESEARMEKLLNALWSLVPVVIMNDEADLGDADRNSPKGDSGVSERLMRSWMTFRSDPKIRGKVIVIDCTNRPDRMDAALMRSGRSDERILLPMPSAPEIPAIFQVMFQRYAIKTSIDDFSKYAMLVDGLSGADIEKISRSSLDFASAPGTEDEEVVVDEVALKKAIDDFIPSGNQAENDRMTLAGLLMTSSRQLLPPNIVKLLTDIRKRNLVPNMAEIFAQIRERRIVDLPVAKAIEAIQVIPIIDTNKGIQ